MLQSERLRTIIGDPHAPKRKRERQCGETRATLRRAKQAVTSKSGKALLRKRGEFIERSFCHVLDQGGMRRATLKGCVNLTKRLVGAVLAFNLSLLMRHLHGVGTPKQWEARAQRAILAAMDWLRRTYNSLWRKIGQSSLQLIISWRPHSISRCAGNFRAALQIGANSTGC